MQNFEAFRATYRPVIPMLAFGYARLGEPESAREALHSAFAHEYSTLGRDYTWSASLAMFVEAAAMIDDGSFNRQLLRELEPYRGQLVVLSDAILCLGAADRYLAMLDFLEGRTDDAMIEFESALALEAQYPAPPLVARTQYWYGVALATRAERHEHARAILRASMDTATSLGMRDLARDAQALLHTIGS